MNLYRKHITKFFTTIAFIVAMFVLPAVGFGQTYTVAPKGDANSVASASAVTACVTDWQFSMVTSSTAGNWQNILISSNGTPINGGWGTISGLGYTYLNWASGEVGAQPGVASTTIYCLITTASNTMTFSLTPPSCLPPKTNIVNSGGVYVTNTANISAANITNTSGTISNSGTITLTGDLINTAGSITNVENTSAAVTITGSLTNNATVNNNCGDNITVSGTFSQGASGVVRNTSVAHKYSKFAVTTTGTNSGKFGYGADGASGGGDDDYIIYSGGTITGNVGVNTLNNSTASPSCTAVLPSPTLTAAVGATVDANVVITFTNDATWLAAGGTVVKYGATTLTLTTDYTLAAGVLTLKPSGGASCLRTPGTQTVTITKTGYLDATVSQSIAVGAANKLIINTQPALASLNGTSLSTQPVVYVQDQYGNATTSTAAVTATVGVGSGSWTLGGTTTINAVSGTATFTAVTATGTAAVSGATIIFTSSGLVSATSNPFNVPIPQITLTAASSPTVDAAFAITFVDNSAWRAAITGITVNGTPLTSGYAFTAGTLTLTPSASAPAALLQNSLSTKNIVITATGYFNTTVTQKIGAGVATKLAMCSQPVAGNIGAVLSTQPAVYIEDQYSNVTTSNALITAAVGAGVWTMGGTTTILPAFNGIAAFTNLTVATATSPPVTGSITFSATGLTSVTSNTFTIAYAVFYSNSADLSVLTNWWTATNGSGSHPSNFTTSGNTFIVQSATTCPVSGSLTIGSGVTLQVLGTVTTAAAVTINGTLQVNGTLTPGAAYTVSGTGALNGSGTVKVTGLSGGNDDFNNQYSVSSKTVSSLTIEFNGAGAQYINNYRTDYYYIRINNSSGTTTLSGGSWTSTSILEVVSGKTLALGTNVFKVYNSVINNGTITGSGAIDNGEICLTDGSSAYTISGTGTYYNLKYNDSEGATVQNTCSVTGIFHVEGGNVTLACGVTVTTVNMEVIASGIVTGPTTATYYTRVVNTNPVTNAGSIGASSSYIAFSSTITGAGTVGSHVLQSSLQTASCAPGLTTSVSTLSKFNYVTGSGPSVYQSYTISGSNLTGNITVTAPTDYEVCATSGGTYTASITLTVSGGIITGQPLAVYVRLKAGKTAGAYNSESVTNAGGGATTVNVSCSGNVWSALSAVNSTLTPTSSYIVATGTSTKNLTVTANNNEYGLTVAITKSSGTGTISAVTDNGDGTYTATVTSPTSSGSGVFVATISGSAVQNGGGSQTQATVTYTKIPTQIIVTSGNSQTAFSGCAVSTQPSVTVEAADGSAVPGVTVVFSVGSGGGSITGATQVTNASGVATVGSWTLGSTGTNTLLVNATAITSNSQIQYPFPQSLHFKYPYGIEASNPNYTRLQSLVTTWIGNYYREGTLPNSVAAARIQWDDTTKTVSEGMGYGLVIMVYTENATNQYQAKFNKLWQYYNYYRDNSGNGLMSWQITGFGTNPNNGAATDADLDVGLALIMAHKQWGSNTPDANGISIDYLSRAKEVFHAIYQTEVDGSHLLKPGDSWGTTYNPSYAELFAIKLAADEQAAGVLTATDDWASVYTAMQGYITHYQNATTGLLPNWTSPNASGTCYSAGYNAADNKCGGIYDQGCLYGIDALRVPWRLAWDYSWYGTPSSKVTSDLISAWLTGTANNGPGDNPRKVLGMYNTDGTYNSECSNIAGTINGMGYMGGFTHAFMTGSDQTSLDAWYEYIQDTTLAYTTIYDPNTSTSFTDYYNHTLQILYLLTVSGNTPNFYSANPVVTGTPISFTSTAVSTVYSKPTNAQDLSVLTNWYQNTNGTGLQPCNFTTSGTIFIVQSGYSYPFNSSTAFGSGVTLTVNGTVTPTSSVVLSGSGTLNGTGTVVVNKVGGSSTSDDFDNQYTISNRTISGLTINYAGASAQYIHTTHAFNNVTINNSSGVTLNANNSISGALTMTGGVLTTLSADTINLKTTGTLSETAINPSSYVIGNIRTKRTIGTTPGNQTFGGLGVDLNETTQSIDSTVVTRTTGTSCTKGGHTSIKRYFTITPTTDAGLSGTMVFHYFDVELTGTGCTEANLKLYKSTDGRATWAVQSSSAVTTASNYLTLTGITSFSDWTASDVTNEPLPIELLTFTAKKLSESTVLNWETVTETNNDYFTLERSTDGVNWEEVYTCKGAGTSTIQHNYSFTDYEQQSGAVYYKLKQTDINGDYTYSNIVSVTSYESTSPIKAFPNPFDGREIYITGLQEKSYAISLYNVLGTEVFTTHINLDGDVVVILDFDEQLSPGNYFIKCVSAHQLFTQQLIVK